MDLGVGHVSYMSSHLTLVSECSNVLEAQNGFARADAEGWAVCDAVRSPFSVKHEPETEKDPKTPPSTIGCDC
jgi:hypothetical protein